LEVLSKDDKFSFQTPPLHWLNDLSSLEKRKSRFYKNIREEYFGFSHIMEVQFKIMEVQFKIMEV